jgi:hypothetical protein
MLVVETIARIRREHFIKGKTIKEIARDLKVSRNTVRKVLGCGCAFERMGGPRCLTKRPSARGRRHDPRRGPTPTGTCRATLASIETISIRGRRCALDVTTRAHFAAGPSCKFVDRRRRALNIARRKNRFTFSGKRAGPELEIPSPSRNLNNPVGELLGYKINVKKFVETALRCRNM